MRKPEAGARGAALARDSRGAGAYSVVAIAVFAALGALQPASPRALPATAAAATPAAGNACRASLPPAPGADMVCNQPGGPEGYAEQASRLSQQVARSAAPFRSMAPGAYQAAVQQRATLARAGTILGSGSTWQAVGGTPQC